MHVNSTILIMKEKIQRQVDRAPNRALKDARCGGAIVLKQCGSASYLVLRPKTKGAIKALAAGTT